MMHKAWNSIEEVPYCFSRSYVKLQGHTALKIVEFDPNWAFPDCNSSLKSPMATKWCTKLWSSIVEVPYCFSRSYIKFQGHTVQNITDFDPNWAFPDYRPVAAFKSLRFALFKVIRQISRSHGSKNRWIWPKLVVSGLYLQFEFTNGYEMIHKAWSSIEEMPYCFWGSSVKCLGHTAQKPSILTRIERFRTVTQIWIHQWVWNAAQSLK